MITLDNLNEVFDEPDDLTDSHRAAQRVIREAYKTCAITVLRNTPHCPAQTAALDKLVTAMYAALHTIATRGQA